MKDVDFARYEAMRTLGAGPESVYLTAREDGLGLIELVDLLRGLFSLTTAEAIKVHLAGEMKFADALAESLAHYRGEPIPSRRKLRKVLESAQTKPMDRFRLRWRWTDKRWNPLPAAELAKIRPLSCEAAKMLRRLSLAFYHALKRRRDLFAELAEFDASIPKDPNEARYWLRTLPVEEDRFLFVSWHDDLGVITESSTFCDFWENFCHPAENVIVWPESERWGLLYDHDERFRFGLREVR